MGLWWRREWGCVQPSVPKLLYSVCFVAVKRVFCSLREFTQDRIHSLRPWTTPLRSSWPFSAGDLLADWIVWLTDWLPPFCIRYFICFDVMYTVIYVVSCSWGLSKSWYALKFCGKIIVILIVCLILGLRYTEWTDKHCVTKVTWVHWTPLPGWTLFRPEVQDISGGTRTHCDIIICV